jgi:tetratricopeptide (TPR) repeat protein
VAPDTLYWISELATLCTLHSIKISGVRSLCADLSWHAREKGYPYPHELPGFQSSTGADPQIVGVYIEAYRLRFDFHFDELGRHCIDWLQEYPDDALIQSFAAFSALGKHEPQGMNLYRAAIDSANADRRSRHTCLAAMWFAYHIPEQAQEILDLSSVMMAKGETDANVFYRRAAALRKLGRFDQAIEDVDRAISMLGVGANLVHQDYVRERELIVSSMEIRTYLSSLSDEIRGRLSTEARQQIEAASIQLADRVDTAQRVVSDGLLKIVEILGLFVALIGFVAGSGAIVIKSQDLGQRIISMSLVVAGSLAFFILLRFATSFRRNR